MSLVEKLFGSFSDRELKKINPLTKQVLALEGKYQAMSDAELQAQTPALKQQLADGKTLDNILPDAFAVCREAAWRVLGMKHFPVQVTGGIALHVGGQRLRHHEAVHKVGGKHVEGYVTVLVVGAWNLHAVHQRVVVAFVHASQYGV